MLMNFLKPVLIFVPLAVIQLVFIPFVSIENMAPNIIIVLIVFYSLIYGQMFGTVLGFALGFLFDLISGGLLGGFMFVFTIAGFISGFFHNENKYDINTASYVFSIIVFLCATVSLFIYSTIINVNNDVKIIYQVVEEGIVPGIYTAIFSIPVIIFNPRKGM